MNSFFARPNAVEGDVSVQASAHGDHFPPESARKNRRNNGQAPSRRPIWTSRERKGRARDGPRDRRLRRTMEFRAHCPRHDTGVIVSPKRPVKKARHCEHGSLSAAKSRRAWLSASLNECRRLGGSISGQSLVPGRVEAGCVIRSAVQELATTATFSRSRRRTRGPVRRHDHDRCGPQRFAETRSGFSHLRVAGLRFANHQPIVRRHPGAGSGKNC